MSAIQEGFSVADFCKKCSIDMFGEDFRELAGISTKEDTDNGLFASAICEGCGFIQVNHDGECVTDDCIENGHKPKIVCPVVEEYVRRKSDDDIPF